MASLPAHEKPLEQSRNSRERESIEMAFEAIVEQRQLGKLTDSTRVAAVLEAIHQLAKIHEFSIKTELARVAATDPKKFTWKIWLGLSLEETASQRQKDDWKKFVKRVDETLLSSFPGIVQNESSDTQAAWIIDTKVWDGPETIMKRMRKKWED